MQVLWNHALLHRQHHLGQARHPRSRLQVADVGFDRSDEQRLIGVATLAVGGGDSAKLNGVAHRRAGAVGLHVVHLRWGDAGPGQRFLDHLLLRLAVRHGQPGAGSVLVQCRAPDDAPNSVAVALGLGQPLQHQDPAALAPHIPVGGIVERLALPVGGEHPGVAPQLEQPTGQDDVDPSGQGQISLSSLKPRYRLMHGG